MIIQEPVQAAIWHALNNYDYKDAVFLSERLYAEVGSDDALFLLATSYFRARNLNAVYGVLGARTSLNPQCRFLLAQCCLELGKFSEAEMQISGSIIAKSRSIDEIVSEFGDSAPFALKLLGDIYRKNERLKNSIDAYKKSLKLNPFLWSSYEALIDLGEKPDPQRTFNLSHLDNFNHCQGTNPLITMLNKETKSEDSSHVTPKIAGVFTLYNNNQPPVPTVAMIKCNTESEVITPDPPSTWQPLAPRSKLLIPSRVMGTRTPGSPSFGVLPLESSTSITRNITTAALQESYDLPNQKQPRRSHSINSPKFQIFGVSSNTNVGQTQPTQNALSPGNLSSVRRSSRLFSTNNSVKENNKSSSRSGRFISKTPSKKAKTRTVKSSQVKESELNELNNTENKVPSSSPSLAQTALNLQKSSAEGLMQLLQELGKARLLLGQYYSNQAIEVLEMLPNHHYRTGWVLCAIGRAHFELGEYIASRQTYDEVRTLEPYRMDGLEYYSTVLWHLQQEVTLASITNEVIDTQKNSPQAWCVAGNCFSLQKEHETSIKFLQRAIQVDPDFVYAYTLLGHEHVMTEELERAMACFRNALRIDSRHYNAWYGIGMIYYKQEKFSLAELHFRKAQTINPYNSVLLCHIGVVQHSLKKMEASLVTLNKAIGMDPRNPLCKFHRASVYFSMDKHIEALAELNELKELVPKESLVYFLIGKVYKKLGDTQQALMNFSWAMDLDPKGSNNQIKEAIDKQYTIEEEDTQTSNELPPTTLGGISGPREVSRNPTSEIFEEELQVQAMESDDSF